MVELNFYCSNNNRKNYFEQCQTWQVWQVFKDVTPEKKISKTI